MGVSWYAVIVLVATALGASIGLKFIPYRVPSNEPVVKTSRILRTIMQVSEKQVLEKSACGRVWVTVHSPSINQGDRVMLQDAIELNWDFNKCDKIPKRIGLFDDRPGSWNNALQVFSIDAKQGYVITTISLGDPALPAGWDKGPGLKGPHCLWPWAGAGDGSTSITSYNCLKIQPSWMEDNPDINRLRVGELAIAGTHNAGAWRFDTEISTVSRDSFVLCQDRSVWAQLVHGIRYFDFRVAYYDFYPDQDDRYWLNHNLIRVRPLVPLLKEIRAFLDGTKEIVFLDAHHFPIGFYEQDGSPIRVVHQGLIQLVQRELGPHVAFSRDFGTGAGTKGPTVQSLLDANKRLLFSYVDNAIVSENNWLWPTLPHLWANTNNPSELYSYLDRAIGSVNQSNARSPMHSAMAQTTPTVLDILFLRGSLRENADAVNRNVTQHLQTTWRKNANIVSSDFFLGNDVVDVSIAISLERSRKSRWS
ncbi:PI-PLC X domain-containing protein 3 isoform X2 [Leguminivora glycinivorella]|uniref:PI-PLC X domain-containing protein 3 isoform X2 n=1 Tax=Leguminivora glycinivorella TaxID=1035111 RepID=UPI00200EAEA9|nr:PI-PLC X domain-containing protein 3 isoform X2 [Leguminivora glycinivorella]